MWRAKFGTHSRKFNRPNREKISLLVWGLRVCVKARSLWAGLFWIWEWEAIPCNWQWWKQFMLWRVRLSSPSFLGHLVLLQCWLGSYSKRNNKSSTCWSKVVEPKSKVYRSLWKAWPKKWGLSLNPCGKTVQVNCWDWYVSGSIQVKANRGCEKWSRGIVKKVCLRSSTVK